MTGERVILTIDRNGFVVKSEPAEGGTARERFEGLVDAVTRDHGRGEITMAVRCDGCDRFERVEQPELPPGWQATEVGDLCPTCLEP